jgi:hypothetical protein
MRGVVSEALASRKVVYCEVSTEGSETAKSGTDEQERHMRHNCLGKQSQLCNAQSIQEKQLCRCRSHWTRERALTRGGLGIDSDSMSQEVSRGHISWRIRAAKKKTRRTHKTMKG